MSAVKAVVALLSAAPGVIAVVDDRVYAGDVPLNKPRPAIAVREIGGNREGAIDAQAETSLETSRVQVTVHVKTYPEIATVLRAARRACNFERGMIAGVDVVSIVRDLVGPDLDFPDGWGKSIDFMVTYHEPN
jgi:hypothetical protein